MTDSLPVPYDSPKDSLTTWSIFGAKNHPKVDEHSHVCCWNLPCLAALPEKNPSEEMERAMPSSGWAPAFSRAISWQPRWPWKADGIHPGFIYHWYTVNTHVSHTYIYIYIYTYTYTVYMYIMIIYIYAYTVYMYIMIIYICIIYILLHIYIYIMIIYNYMYVYTIW